MEQNATGPQPDRLWTLEETARYLGFSQVWVRQKVQQGLLRCIAFGVGPKAPKRFEASEVRRFCAQHCQRIGETDAA